MKPISLEFCGINSFSEKASIDFEKLLEFGLFGIFGDTGSGKSTILDAIGFALYGSVTRCPRPYSIADIINYKHDSAYVNFEFEIVFDGKRRRYRVERTLKRKGAAQTVDLYEYENGARRAIASGPRTADPKLEEIIGLEQRDFERCIALPQGQFAQFVKAPPGERLKLMSRLFDLERYGAALTKQINKKTAEADRTLGELNVRLEPYAEISAEANAALAAEIEGLRAAETEARAAADSLREEEKSLSARFAKKQEAEQTAQRLARLTERLPAMDALGRELSRLEKAAFVVAAERDGRELRAQSVKAKERVEEANARLTRAAETCFAAETWDEEAADAEIEELLALHMRASAAEKAEERRKRAAARVGEIDGEKEAFRTKFLGFFYDDEKAEFEKKRAELGKGDFLTFAETYGKAALFREEYGEMARELNDLTLKYPEIAEDSAPLIEKYTRLGTGEEIGFSDLRREYEARESARKQLDADMLRLEARRGEYELAQRRTLQLDREREELEAEIAVCAKEIEGVTASPSEIMETVERKKLARRRMLERRTSCREELSKSQAALTAAEEISKNADAALQAARARFCDTLKAGGFESAEEAELLAAKYPDPAAAKRGYEAFRTEYAAVRARSEELAGEDFSLVSRERLDGVRSVCKEKEEETREISRKLALAERKLAEGESRLLEKAELEKNLQAARKRYDGLDLLRGLVRDGKFMEFVAEEYLQTVAVNASTRLISLTDGRYFLRYDGGFFVGDNFNGGKLRGVHTLSGGETFLVSLSLALALGAEICARSLRPIEFFFLDEGFGTLDSHLVDTVMDSLEKLRNEHFSIGIISHVGELKNRIDRKLLVTKATEECGSVIKPE